MRRASGMKLSNRLVAFVTVIVLSAIFVIFIGGALSFRTLGLSYQDHYLQGIVDVIEQEVNDASDAHGQKHLARWLPKLLQASNVIDLTVEYNNQTYYHYTQPDPLADPNLLYRTHYTLGKTGSVIVNIASIPPYTELTYSIGPMSSISLAILIIIIGLVRGVNWLRRQLTGSEMLEERGRMILAGRVDQYAEGKEQEWPGTASLALDQLIAELKDARQERSRFDTFIRTHTFLDQLTGAANRVLFDSRLQSMVQEPDSQGVVILIRIDDWDELQNERGKEVADEFIQDVGVVLTNFSQRYPDTLLARYFDAEFAMLIPQQSAKEIKLFTNQMLHALERIKPSAPMELDNWFHIGVTYYQTGERRGRIMDEADMALRSAQLQRCNSWCTFKKDQQFAEGRGSVRWRSLLDAILNQGGPLLFQQAVFIADKDQILHRELLARIQDENGILMKASGFIPAVNMVGFNVRFDRSVVTKALALLQTLPAQEALSVNLSVEALLDKNFSRWLRDQLLQTPRTVLNRLSFEVPESQLVKHLDAMRPILRMVAGLGCQLVIDQAGKTIVSTHYIKDIKADYIKLHRGLVRDIHQRQENQLFVRSMLGACEITKAKLIAVGVESDKEWQVLKQLGVYGGQGRLFAAELSVKRIKK